MKGFSIHYFVDTKQWDPPDHLQEIVSLYSQSKSNPISQRASLISCSTPVVGAAFTEVARPDTHTHTHTSPFCSSFVWGNAFQFSTGNTTIAHMNDLAGLNTTSSFQITESWNVFKMIHINSFILPECFANKRHFLCWFLSAFPECLSSMTDRLGATSEELICLQ